MPQTPIDPEDASELTPEEILAKAINRNTDARFHRLRNVVIAAATIVLLVLGVLGVVIGTLANTVSTQNELLSRRSTTITYLGCITDYLFAVIDSGPDITPAEQEYVEATRENLERARAADLEEGQDVPKCVPPPRPPAG